MQTLLIIIIFLISIALPQKIYCSWETDIFFGSQDSESPTNTLNTPPPLRESSPTGANSHLIFLAQVPSLTDIFGDSQLSFLKTPSSLPQVDENTHTIPIQPHAVHCTPPREESVHNFSQSFKERVRAQANRILKKTLSESHLRELLELFREYNIQNEHLIQVLLNIQHHRKLSKKIFLNYLELLLSLGYRNPEKIEAIRTLFSRTTPMKARFNSFEKLAPTSYTPDAIQAMKDLFKLFMKTYLKTSQYSLILDAIIQSGITDAKSFQKITPYITNKTSVEERINLILSPEKIEKIERERLEKERLEKKRLEREKERLRKIKELVRDQVNPLLNSEVTKKEIHYFLSLFNLYNIQTIEQVQALLNINYHKKLSAIVLLSHLNSILSLGYHDPEKILAIQGLFNYRSSIALRLKTFEKLAPDYHTPDMIWTIQGFFRPLNARPLTPKEYFLILDTIIQSRIRYIGDFLHITLFIKSSTPIEARINPLRYPEKYGIKTLSTQHHHPHATDQKRANHLGKRPLEPTIAPAQKRSNYQKV